MSKRKRLGMLSPSRVQVQILPFLRERHVQGLRDGEVLHHLQPQHDPRCVGRGQLLGHRPAPLLHRRCGFSGSEIPCSLSQARRLRRRQVQRILLVTI